MLHFLDVETDGLHPYQGDRMFAYALGDDEGNCAIHRKDKNKNWLEPLRYIWTNPDTEIVGHNAKFDQTYKVLQHDGNR